MPHISDSVLQDLDREITALKTLSADVKKTDDRRGLHALTKDLVADMMASPAAASDADMQRMYDDFRIGLPLPEEKPALYKQYFLDLHERRLYLASDLHGQLTRMQILYREIGFKKKKRGIPADALQAMAAYANIVLSDDASPETAAARKDMGESRVMEAMYAISERRNAVRYENALVKRRSFPRLKKFSVARLMKIKKPDQQKSSLASNKFAHQYFRDAELAVISAFVRVIRADMAMMRAMLAEIGGNMYSLRDQEILTAGENSILNQLENREGDRLESFALHFSWISDLLAVRDTPHPKGRYHIGAVVYPDTRWTSASIPAIAEARKIANLRLAKFGITTAKMMIFNVGKPQSDGLQLPRKAMQITRYLGMMSQYGQGRPLLLLEECAQGVNDRGRIVTRTIEGGQRMLIIGPEQRDFGKAHMVSGPAPKKFTDLAADIQTLKLAAQEDRTTNREFDPAYKPSRIKLERRRYNTALAILKQTARAAVLYDRLDGITAQERESAKAELRNIQINLQPVIQESGRYLSPHEGKSHTQIAEEITAAGSQAYKPLPANAVRAWLPTREAAIARLFRELSQTEIERTKLLMAHDASQAGQHLIARDLARIDWERTHFGWMNATLERAAKSHISPKEEKLNAGRIPLAAVRTRSLKLV